MASESAINGTFSSQNGYGSIEQAGYTAASYPSSNPSAPSQSNNSAADIPKDEVGWYFVEQYYTTLSRSPEKVYLFYNKRSQFVSGNETEKVEVCVGQRAINERIKELDFSECKVRVTNVDSQASDDHIVIQVIGEISNKSAPHKKFTQTFVLAAQTNGYFVLNDIFRYIVEEEDEAEATGESAAVQEPAPAAAQEPEHEHETLTSSEDPAAVEKDAAKVDKVIEEKIIAEKPEEETAAPAAVNGSPKAEPAEVAEAEEAPAAAVQEATETPEAAPEAVSEVPAAQEELPVEKPKDPEPTPAVRSPVKQAAQPAKAAAPSKPAAPAAPAAPKTWANLAAAAHRVATPVVTPQPSTAAPAQPKAASQSEATTKPAPAAPVQDAPAAAPARESSPAAPSADQQEEWTSVGDKRQQNKGQAAAGAQETPQNRAYVKNVHESIALPTLREALEKYGELTYFDANRPKNCAFVDFKTIDGYKAALKASPLSIGEHAITIEERRPKSNAPFFPGGRGGARGGRGGANQAPRGSFQGGRGGGSQRGRGGNASRGRGGAQAA
ncbi:hypothetical protein E4T47_08321 [Aureobasidium subglaciale]|nr:hypothetical protein E4T47_08321 [Aureobasidium subglaciale]